ncbi:mitogen-activated protein kinaseorganizer 1 [Monoraphidium neglectum]|uniref:Mitogen-activated protein kinaseorganizer 1 n=1 Tax=Monoraphidium neglectum TaxID=145388 RepID=A0A0D2JDS1_9CHLO|nr:mitogen-activated protein kinaseorganizer 1 [Monoraphidium neglectum]KIY97662.1 mitogen-activated protein kinaseorganizer 1 [Monoraphidium neglectum]|eukprot:XP_013896682.1 mitogen-activated protein kinaseorganizer 1 [Monoraphidium neglectum]
MRAFKDDVTSVAASGHEILGGSVDGTLRRFDIRVGRAYCDDVRHPVTSAVFSGDGLCLLAACLDSTLRLIDKATGELLASYRGHTHTGVKMGCALMPGDAFVVGASEDGRLCYWELVDAQLLLSFQAHRGPVCGVAAHPKGTCVLTAGVDGVVKVWMHSNAPVLRF